jgi:hypothetical protein
MSARATRIIARITFFFCGLGSLLTAVPYVLLRGSELPVQSEWIIFVVALALVGLFSLLVAVLPRSWIARACRQNPEDKRLFSLPLKLLGVFAAIAYLVAVVGYFAPHTLELDPQWMLLVCPMYFLKMSIDPEPTSIFFILAPMNAAVYGADWGDRGICTVGDSENKSRIDL